MRTEGLAVIAATLTLTACTTSVAPTNGSSENAITVPEAVAQIAGPHQDLSTARILPEDGCYWYLHAGPVETTLIPLRTAQGNPICTSAYRPAEGTTERL